jgi:signal transduction histidine kinase
MIAELDAALLQGVVTLGTAAVCWYLYARYRRAEVLWWAVAWSAYVLRIGAIVGFLATRAQPWLFAHQVLTGWTALALLWAALTYSRAAQWRRWYALAVVFPVAWSYIAIYQLQSFMLAVVPAVLFLSLATLWTGVIFAAQYRRTRSRGALVLAGVLITWALHHLDYPILRAMGSWNPWGYYLDILFVLAMDMGIVLLVLEALDGRSRELERLSARMVRQHEDERRRVSRELHDQSAQVWAAVKLQLGLVRERAPAPLLAPVQRVLALVDGGMRSIRSVTTNLRPPLLDDLGLLPALRALAQAFQEQSGLHITMDAPPGIPRVTNDAGLALYRALQEALSNVARHSGATAVRIRVIASDADVALIVSDNGKGFPATPDRGEASTGLSGMQERIAAVRGSVTLGSDAGASVTVRVPADR